MSLKSFYFLAIGFGAVGTGGFVLGRWMAPESKPAGSVALVGARSAPAAAQKTVSLSGEASPADGEASQSKRLAQRIARLGGSIAAEDERQRNIEEWAELDPRATIEFVRTQLKGERQAQAMASVISIWGKKDPAAAWSWVSKEMPQATHHFDNLLEVFGRNSPETAGRYAAAYSAAHPEAALEVHLAALLGVTYSGDFAAARALVQLNGSLDPIIRSNLNNFIAGQWARYAPEKAAAWVLSLPAGPERDQALIGLGESWSEIDSAGATTFAAQLPVGPARTLAMRQAISKWIVEDPNAARDWVLKSERHEDFDQAVESIATQNNMMSREPARALRWASGIFDDTLRAKTVSTILFNWYPGDAEAATAYLQNSSDFNPQEREELLNKLRPSS